MSGHRMVPCPRWRVWRAVRRGYARRPGGYGARLAALLAPAAGGAA